MKRYLMKVAPIFVMIFNAVISSILPSPTCDISPSMQQITEIRERFLIMRSAVQQQDKYIHLQILDISSTESISPSQKCCFLKHIIHFYMTQVFKHYRFLDTQYHSSASAIANSFCALSRDPKPCHFDISCSCGDVAMNKMKTIKYHFNELSSRKAVVKAFGELDILLDWMEELF